jgi:hypothetical protein
MSADHHIKFQTQFKLSEMPVYKTWYDSSVSLLVPRPGFDVRLQRFLISIYHKAYNQNSKGV